MKKIVLLSLVVLFLTGITFSVVSGIQEKTKQKVLTVEEIKNKKIDWTKLPDSQLILVKGKARTVKELKAMVSKMEREMKTASARMASQTEAQVEAYQGEYQTAQRQAQNQLITRAKAQLQKTISQQSKVGDRLDRGSAAASAPVISSISVNHGKSGDPVLIEGENFGDRAGSLGCVTFTVAPGKEVNSPIEHWSTTTILTFVPDVGIATEFNGKLQVTTRTPKRSNMVNFRVEPTIVIVPFPLNDYKSIPRGCSPCSRYISWNGEWISVEHSANFVAGGSRDDIFAERMLLKNGWIVDEVVFQKSHHGNADANMVEKHKGTNNPYVKVHWWMDGFTSVTYHLVVFIKGPKGVPLFR